MKLQKCYVAGDPIAHSLSPAIHNAAFRACGLNVSMSPLRLGDGQANQAVALMRQPETLGMSITMPLKHEVVKHLDYVESGARAVDAVNCLYKATQREPEHFDSEHNLAEHNVNEHSSPGSTKHSHIKAELGRGEQPVLCGANTDGEGFTRWLLEETSIAKTSLSGLKVVVFGAGGAARSVIHALLLQGCDVTVINRNKSRAQQLKEQYQIKVGGLEDLQHGALVINATPVGMNPEDALLFNADLLSPSAVVCDLIYHPFETALLAHCKAAGYESHNGLGMLIFQAVRQFELWTGEQAPVDIMRQGALDALAKR